MAVTSEANIPVNARLAPAKINLFLHIVGRRDDGYHLLESLVAFASIGDRLTVEAGTDGQISLTTVGPFAGQIDGYDHDNLVLRAAHTLSAKADDDVGARMTLEKNLPVAAGIGGGSADAATALQALNQAWDLGLSPAELAEIGLPLGADLPVCLAGRPVMMRGIGENLSPGFLPEGLGVVLVNPRLPLPTPAVFADFRSFGRFAPMQQHDWAGEENPGSWLDRLATTTNSLEAPARQLLPVIDTMIDAIAAQTGCLLARMSGSGATCFGLFDDWQTAARRADQLKRDHPEWWIAPGRLMP